MFDRKKWRKEWDAKNKDRIRGYEKKRRNSVAGKASKKRRDEKYRNKPENKVAMRLYGQKYRKNNRKRRLVNNKRYKQSEKGIAARRRDLIRVYGITIEQHNQMLEQQNGVCAICGGLNKNGKNLGIDHCHRTNKVRGLLCMKCNLTLGAVDDSIELLANAIRYLEKERSDNENSLTKFRVS